MGDKHFTLLELHLDGDVQFGPKSMGLPGDEDEEAEEAEGGESIDVEGPEDTDGEGGSGAGRLLIGLVVVVVLAGVLRKVLGGDADVSEEIPGE
ncbi:MAG: hypothetical protein ACI9YT_001147 [Halobacteriales archaeon]|jgi:hypothetical protein